MGNLAIDSCSAVSLGKKKTNQQFKTDLDRAQPLCQLAVQLYLPAGGTGYGLLMMTLEGALGRGSCLITWLDV